MAPVFVPKQATLVPTAVTLRVGDKLTVVEASPEQPLLVTVTLYVPAVETVILCPEPPGGVDQL